MRKEQKAELFKGIMGIVKGILFFIFVGAFVRQLIMGPERYKAWMEGDTGLFWELGSMWFLGFVWVLGAYVTWGLFNFCVLGKSIPHSK